MYAIRSYYGSIQMILREVNNDSLTIALRTASDEIKEKIFTNMSSRAADMIRDDLSAMGPVRFRITSYNVCYTKLLRP